MQGLHGLSKRAETGRSRILWKNLNGDAVETFRATVFEKLSTLGEDMSVSDVYQMCNTLARSIKDAAKDFVDSKEGANDINRIAKARKRRRRDLGNIRINQGEVRVALQKMGRNKAIRPDQIPMEAWRCFEDEGVKWLTFLFNKIFLSVKRLDEWRLSEVIPIYKNKGDTQKYRERQRDLHMAFLDLEKAYDSIPRELIWRILIDKGTPKKYLRVIRDMYEGAKTRVRSIVGNTKFFPVKVGLHQGLAISPYLFALILDELSRRIQENIPWSMVFTEDIVLVAESVDGLNMRLES
ncbi:retrovirus-related pol polyprotein LINE-1 [Tanacetum coccineum]